MTNMCSPLFFKVSYNLGLDKKSFFLASVVLPSKIYSFPSEYLLSSKNTAP